MKDKFNLEILTPVKATKGMSVLKKIIELQTICIQGQYLIRQPIEALFSWLIEKEFIQKASKDRSTKGLILNAYERLSAAFITLIFNS